MIDNESGSSINDAVAKLKLRRASEALDYPDDAPKSTSRRVKASSPEGLAAMRSYSDKAEAEQQARKQEKRGIKPADLNVGVIKSFIDGFLEGFQKEAKRIVEAERTKSEKMETKDALTGSCCSKIEDSFQNFFGIFKGWTQNFVNMDNSLDAIVKSMGIENRKDDLEESRAAARGESELFNRQPGDESGLTVGQRLAGRGKDFASNTVEMFRSMITSLISGAVKGLLGLGAAGLAVALLPKEYQQLIGSALKGIWEGLEDVVPGLKTFSSLISGINTIHEKYISFMEATLFPMFKRVGEIYDEIKGWFGGSKKPSQDQNTKDYITRRQTEEEQSWRAANPEPDTTNMSPRAKRAAKAEYNTRYDAAMDAANKRIDGEVSKGGLPPANSGPQSRGKIGGAPQVADPISTPGATPNVSGAGDSYNYDSYASAIGARESNNNYAAVNTLGFLGKYQFGAAALEDIGLLKKGASKGGNSALNNPSNWTIPGGKEAFLSDPAAQEDAMKRYTASNLRTLKKIGVLGKNASPSDVASALAASHLVGPGGAKKTLSGEDQSDAYGTKSSEYMKLGASSQMPSGTQQPPAPTAGIDVSRASTAIQATKEARATNVNVNAPTITPQSGGNQQSSRSESVDIPSPVAYRGSVDRDIYFTTAMGAA